MKCICKEDHWNDFSKGGIYHYKEEFSVGGFSHVFLIKNDQSHVYAFDLAQFKKDFYTERELRKLKLERINERQVNL